MIELCSSVLSAKSLESVRLIVLDLDGVVYCGNQLVQGADGAIKDLLERGYIVRYATNASARHREALAAKLVHLGVPAAPGEVYSSADATCFFISKLLATGRKKVHVCGHATLVDLIREVGAEIVNDASADVVVVGFDTGFSYEKLTKVVHAIHDGAFFVACNVDTTYPVENGRQNPACGPLVAAVQCAAGRGPDYIVGKPNVLLLQMICEELGLTFRDILVVGDSLESDIAMANRFKALSALCAAKAPAADVHIQPDFVIDSLAQLPSLLRGSVAK